MVLFNIFAPEQQTKKAQMKKTFMIIAAVALVLASCTDGRKVKEFPTKPGKTVVEDSEPEPLDPVKIPRYATHVCDTVMGPWHVVTYVDTTPELIKAEDGEIHDSSLHLTADYNGHRVLDNKEITTSDIIGDNSDREHGFYFGRIIMATQNTLFLQAGAYIYSSDDGFTKIMAIDSDGTISGYLFDILQFENAVLVEEFYTLLNHEMTRHGEGDRAGAIEVVDRYTTDAVKKVVRKKGIKAIYPPSMGDIKGRNIEMGTEYISDSYVKAFFHDADNGRLDSVMADTEGFIHNKTSIKPIAIKSVTPYGE